MRKLLLACLVGLFASALLFLPQTSDAQDGFLQPPPVSLEAAIPLSGHPKGIAVDPATNQVFVALYDVSRVARLDGATNTVTGSHDTGGLHANQIAFNPTNQRLYVTNRDSDELSFMDPATLNVIAKLGVGSQPWGVAVDPGSNQVYVDNFGSSSISLLDGTNGALLTTFTHPSMRRPAMSAYSTGMRRLYAMDWETGNLIVIDTAKQLFIPLTVLAGAFDVAVDPATEHVYMTNRPNGENRIADGSVADPSAMWVNVSNNYPGNSYSIAVNHNTQHYFVVQAWNGRQIVQVRDMRTWEVLQIIDIGSADEAEGGQGLEINPLTNRVYVSNFSDSTLVVLQDAVQATLTPTPTGIIPPTGTPTLTATDIVPPTDTPTATPFLPTATPTPTQPTSALPYVLATFDVGTHPKSVTIDGLRRWYGMVALFDDSRIASFNITDFAVGGNSYTQGTHPNQILYAGSNRLHITNRDSNNYTGLAWNGPGTNCWAPSGELPWGVAAAYDRVYVGNYGAKSWGSVSVYDLQCSALATIPLPNDRPALMTSANGKVYVAGNWLGNLYVIDGSNQVGNPINIGAGAFGLAAQGSAPRVFLTNRSDGRLYIIDATNDNVTGIVKLPGSASAVASNYKTNHMFVVDATNDRVYVVDGVTGGLIATLPVGHQDMDQGGQGIAVSLENNRVFVTNYADGTITVIQDVQAAANPNAAKNVCPAPELASWPDGSTIPYRRVTLDWADPACATRYEIEIRLNAAKGKLVETDKNVRVSQYTTRKALAPGKTYVWRVRACGGDKCSRWSTWWKFTVGTNAH